MMYRLAGRSTSAVAVLAVSTAIHHHLDSKRGLSSNGHAWIAKFRFGFDNGPAFGRMNPAAQSPHDALSSSTSGGSSPQLAMKVPTKRDLSEEFHAKDVYCRALIYASGGGRLARDWIAGCAALTVDDQRLIYRSLQHTATRSDFTDLLEHFALLEADTDGSLTPTEHAEHVGVLKRCFLYDAIKAASCNERILSTDKVNHLLSLSRLMDTDDHVFRELQSIVEEENQVMMEKFRVLDQPLD